MTPAQIYNTTPSTRKGRIISLPRLPWFRSKAHGWQHAFARMLGAKQNMKVYSSIWKENTTQLTSHRSWHLVMWSCSLLDIKSYACLQEEVIKKLEATIGHFHQKRIGAYLQFLFMLSLAQLIVATALAGYGSSIISCIGRNKHCMTEIIHTVRFFQLK